MLTEFIRPSLTGEVHHPSVFTSADLEQGGFFRCFDGVTEYTKSVPEFARGDFPRGTTLLIEDAHMAPRPEKNGSKSQVFTQDELDEIAVTFAERGIAVKLAWPKLTVRAREEYAAAHDFPRIEFKDDNGKVHSRYDIDKTYDARSIQWFYTQHPEISLKSWPRTQRTEEESAWHQATLADANAVLNDLRAFGYEGPLFDRADKVMRDHLNDLTPEIIAFFDVKIRRNGQPSGAKTGWYSQKRVMSVFLMVFDGDGALRLNPAGGPLGLAGAREAFRFHPGKNGGVLRSNLLSRREQWCANRGITRAESNLAIKRLYQLFRDYGQAEFCRPLASASVWSPLAA